MQKRLTVLLTVCCLACMLPMSALGAEEAGPRYTWEPLRKFWNVNCLPGFEIKNFSRTEQGYLVLYPSAISLEVIEKDRIVSEVRAIYNQALDKSGGGRRFLQLMESLITLGTCRWPEERVEQVRRTFANMPRAGAQYSWNTSRFVLYNSPAGGWIFTLYFLHVTP